MGDKNYKTYGIRKNILDNGKIPKVDLATRSQGAECKVLSTHTRHTLEIAPTTGYCLIKSELFDQ